MAVGSASGVVGVMSAHLGPLWLRYRAARCRRGAVDVDGRPYDEVAFARSAMTRSQVPPMELELRQVKPGDVALFDRVADAVFDEAVDPGRLAAYLAEPGHHMLVALLAGEVVAQVAAVIHRHPDKPTELYIDEVGVTPALQRQGIAGAMLEQMLALGKALGCEEAWVGTETDNGPARGLYESRGAAAEPFVLYLFKL